MLKRFQSIVHESLPYLFTSCLPNIQVRQASGKQIRDDSPLCRRQYIRCDTNQPKSHMNSMTTRLQPLPGASVRIVFLHVGHQVRVEAVGR